MKIFLAVALSLSVVFAAPGRVKRQAGCPDPFTNVPSPCAGDLTQRIYFPHPSDVTKFLQCTFFGRMYIIQCPQGEDYDASSSTCNPRAATQAPFVPPVVTQAPVTQAPVVNPVNTNNPCTQTSIARGMLYFPVAGDRTQFIECDLAGNPSVINCASGLLWDQGMLSCVYPINAGVNNNNGGITATPPAPSSAPGSPCTASAIQSGHFFFPYPNDSTKFIQCDLWGNSYDVDCPSGLIWNAYLETCYRSIPGGVGK